MEQLVFDSGIKEYLINGKATLRFNPADPNVYARYAASTEKINEIENDLAEKARKIEENSENFGKESLMLMQEADQRVKKVLEEIFGVGNDMDAIFEGVNVMAVSSNGNRIVANFLEMIGPVIEKGATSFIDKRVEEAKLNRSQRRAMKK